MKVRPGRLVLKCDMLVGSTDVPPQMTLRQAARKSVVMGLSDLAAKGVNPQGALISLGIPRKTSSKNIDELASGFKEARDEFTIDILGGDTNEASDLVIDCAIFGFAKKVVGRDGAKPGDHVVLSGPFGYASAGIRILMEKLKADTKFREKAVSSVLYPQPRIRLGVSLVDNDLLSSSMDSSDGLAITLHELARRSGVGMNVDTLPLPEDLQDFSRVNKLDPYELALHGGEEYEIVATVPRDRLSAAMRVASRCRASLIRIGEVTSNERVRIRAGGKWRNIEDRGWTHLS